MNWATLTSTSASPSCFESAGLSPRAKIDFSQADEERKHAMLFVKFVFDVSGKVVVPAISEPRNRFEMAINPAQLAV